MSNTVPDGWCYCRLDKIVSRFMVPMRDKPKTFAGELPWVRIEDFDGKYLYGSKSRRGVDGQTIRDMKLKVYPKGTVLCSCSARLGVCTIAARELVSNQTFIGLVPDTSLVSSEFLYYRMQSHAADLQRLSSGTTIAYLSREKFEEFEVLAPPLPEQQIIAAILSSVDDVIEKTRAQVDKLKDLKTGMMQELLTKGIGSGGVPHTEFKDSPLGRIPVSWDVYSLTELSSFRRGSFPQPYGLPEWYSETGHPFVQVYDIGNNGRLKPSTKVRISDAAASKSVFVPKGSVAVSIQGSIGRVAITQYDAFFDRTILIFTKLNKNVDREYFALMIGEIFRVKKDSADGGVIKTITKETLKDFLLKLPPIDEQRTISKTLGEIDSNARLKEAKLNKLQAVKKALMQDLLTGKVRVKVDQKESAVA